MAVRRWLRRLAEEPGARTLEAGEGHLRIEVDGLLCGL